MKLVLFFVFLISSIAFADDADDKEGRSFIDLPDVDNGFNIHVMYVLPADGTDKEFDLNSKIGMMVYQMNKWFFKQTKNRIFKEGQFLKFDRKENGKLDITFLRIGLSDETISREGIQAVNTIQPEISRLGFNDPKKIYFVVYGGSNRDVCASSQLPGHVPKSTIANTAAIYYPGKKTGTCAEGEYGFKPEFNMTASSALHEIFHALGVVPKCAPDHLTFKSEGTINDGIGGHLAVAGDIMYSVQSNVTFSKPEYLDLKSINYYNHNNNDCLDLAKSIYVYPTVDNPQLPTFNAVE